MSGNPFRHYASPWKIGFLLVVSLAFVVVAYFMLFGRGAHPGGWNTLIAWAALVLFGLGEVIFGALFAVLVVARRPLLEITEHGWLYRTYPFFLRATAMDWSQIARVGVYRQERGRGGALSYLILFPRSPTLEMALRDGVAPRLLPVVLIREAKRVPLNYYFLRVTPARCERLRSEIQAACASEIARYGVYVEPKVERMP